MKNLKLHALVFIGCIFFSVQCQMDQETEEKPNILWLVSEDNCPYLGCYGDDYATSPNIDKLAAKGFIYTHAYANAPVCAPARNCIITGVYSVSSGNEHMRSSYEKSDLIHLFPKYLREAGYYCTNNSKTDYNIARDQTRNVWDESSNTAHYKNRDPGQPFFAVFNIGNTHESSLHKSKPVEELRHDPQDVKLPPYHPDTPELRHDWAQLYDAIEDMDSEVGKKLTELEESGKTDNTIVFYYGDNGGILARSKRFVYETGTHVPLIVSIPKKYKSLWPSKKMNSKVDRLVSFVDLAPTLLSIAGVQIPDYIQGNAFLGKQKTPDPEYAFMFRGRMDERYDMCRAVRSEKYRYIRNYMPNRIYGQHLYYLWLAPSVRSWEDMYIHGKCNEIQRIFWNPKPVEELYDTENDPWEVNNLANNPDYKNVLDEMREANRDWMLKIRDSGLMPEADLNQLRGGISTYDYMRSGNIQYEQMLSAAEKATNPSSEDLDALTSFLTSGNSAVRYWGAMGLLILGESARPAVDLLKQAINDESPNVIAAASEALYNLGETDIAEKGFIKVLQSSNQFARLFALNSIESINDESDAIKMSVIKMAREAGELTLNNYDHRAAKALFDKWGVNVADYNINVTW